MGGSRTARDTLGGKLRASCEAAVEILCVLSRRWQCNLRSAHRNNVLSIHSTNKHTHTYTCTHDTDTDTDTYTYTLTVTRSLARTSGQTENSKWVRMEHSRRWWRKVCCLWHDQCRPAVCHVYAHFGEHFSAECYDCA